MSRSGPSSGAVSSKISCMCRVVLASRPWDLTPLPMLPSELSSPWFTRRVLNNLY